MPDDRHTQELDFIERESYRVKAYTPPPFYLENADHFHLHVVRNTYRPTVEARAAHEELVRNQDHIFYGLSRRHADRMRGPNLPCAFWDGPWKGNRPLFRTQNREISARNFSYTLAVREIPLNCVAVPQCGRNECVYPGHLAVRGGRGRPNHDLKKVHREAIRLIREGQWTNRQIAHLYKWSDHYIGSLMVADRRGGLEEFERSGDVPKAFLEV